MVGIITLLALVSAGRLTGPWGALAPTLREDGPGCLLGR